MRQDTRISEKDELRRIIGFRLRELRKQAGFTLEQLARRTEFSTPLLSRIENGLAMPSIPTLKLIANILKVGIGYFFQIEDKKRYVISRHGKVRVTVSKRGSKKNPTYTIEHLIDEMPNRWMEPIVATCMRKDEEFEAITHEGQEFIYVIEGKMELTLGEEKFVLKKGDSVYLDGSIPHKAISLSKKSAKCLSVNLIPGRRTGLFETIDEFDVVD